jgi:hypothetical protein
MADDDIKRMPIKDLGQEEGAHELASSPNMEPYLNSSMIVKQGADPTPETRSDPPVAAGEEISLAHRFLPKMGPCRF